MTQHLDDLAAKTMDRLQGLLRMEVTDIFTKNGEGGPFPREAKGLKGVSARG